MSPPAPSGLSLLIQVLSSSGDALPTNISPATWVSWSSWVSFSPVKATGNVHCHPVLLTDCFAVSVNCQTLSFAQFNF